MTKYGVRLAAVLALGVSVVAVASPAQAQGASFDIPAGDVRGALDAFVRQTGQQLVYRLDQVSALRSPGVKGAMSREDALRQLLAGTGLEARKDASGALAIVPARPRAMQQSSYIRSPARALPSQDLAQSEPAAAAPDTAGLDEILVTARRREERLQDVPVAVTALNADQLDRANVVSIQDLRRVAPAIAITPSSGAGRNSLLFSIRGQRQADTLASVDPSVGVYVGDQLFKRTYGLDQVIFDMASVEVLKGPQGTLFGLNTTGGNIVFRPALPSDRFEAMARASLGNFDYRGLEAMVNLPLTDSVALRVAGQYKKRDGYIRNVINGEDSQDLDGGAVRASLRFDFDPFESTFTGSWAKSSTNGMGFRLSSLQKFSGVLGTGAYAGPTDVNCTGPAADTCTATSAFQPTGYGDAALANELAAVKALGFYKVRHSVDSYARTDPAWNIANTSTFAINDDISIKNIIGYRKYRTEQFDDNDGSNLAILEYGNRQHGKEFSEEFQILGDSGDLNWIIGAFYFREKVDSRSRTTGLISPKLLGLKTPYTGIEIVTNTSRSLFASGTQKLDGMVQGLSLTLGGRYTWDKREGTFGFIDRLGYAPGDLTGLGTPSAGQGCTFNPVTDPGILKPEFNFDPATCFVTIGKSFSKFTYSATLDWKLSPTKLIYVAHRKGYRSGGLITRATTSAQLFPFAPETVRDLELGMKLDFPFDNGMFLRANLAAYKQWYSDIQRQVNFRSPDNVLLPGVINAGAATIQGFEAEVLFRPAPWLEFNGFVAHVDPRYRRFIVSSLKPGVGNVDVARTAPFGGPSRWQYGIAGTLTLPTPESVGATTFTVNYYRQSGQFTLDTPDRPMDARLPGYAIMDARLQLGRIAGSPFSAAIFANNLLDKRYIVGQTALSTTFGVTTTLAGPPRMYGIELRVDLD